MPFDLISWAIGFGATQVTRNLIDRLFAQTLRAKLNSVVEEWASSLPENLYTYPEALLDEQITGPERERLQIRLFLHNHVPDADLWFRALLETWEIKKRQLGRDANPFFAQDKAGAEEYLRDLAERLALACAKERELFQVSTLFQLEEIASQAKLINVELGITRSAILNSIENIAFRPHLINQRALTRLLENPHLCHGQGLMELNALLLIDAPSVALAGRLRRGESWVGPPGCTIEEAWYRPPGPDGLNIRVAEFIGRWSSRPSPLESKDTREVILTMAQFHHELVWIHPFEDGNGKVARVLTDYQARHLLLNERPLHLKHDGQYGPALRTADQGNIQPLADLMQTKLDERSH